MHFALIQKPKCPVCLGDLLSLLAHTREQPGVLSIQPWRSFIDAYFFLLVTQ